MLHAAMSDEVGVYQSFPADRKMDITGQQCTTFWVKSAKTDKKDKTESLAPLQALLQALQLSGLIEVSTGSDGD
jgi:hypothetical protein